MTSRSEPGPSMSQNGAQTLHKTHPGTSKPSPDSGTFTGAHTDENRTEPKRGKTRYTPPLVAIKKGLQNLPKTRTKVKELGDKVIQPINDALGRDIGLPTRIRKASVSSSHPDYQKDKFLPTNAIDELLSPETVRKAIAKCAKYQKYSEVRRFRDSTSDIQGDVASICSPQTTDQGQPLKGKSFRKIFIILALLKKASVVTWFIDEGICDDDLPLRRQPETGIKWQPVRSSGVPLPKKVLRKSFFEKFIEKQWLVLAPCFRPSSDDAKDNPQRLTEKHIPPFISWSLIGEGGFGTVYEIGIHPGQHKFSHVSDEGVFAVKVLKSRHSIDPAREHAILKKFKNNRHEHMISILTAYIHNGIYHLILPRALADLHDYWKEVNPSPLEAEADGTLAWLAAQCQGLVEGLSCIHRYETASFECLLNPDSFKIANQSRSNVEGNSEQKLRFFGRHGDIKPENILYYPDNNGGLRGRLVIADFGCTEFSTKEEINRKKRKSVPISATYRAPEIHLSPDAITSSYDMWTLGCVYLEFLTWWFGGWTFVEEFAGQRKELDPYWYGRSNESFRTDSFFRIIKDEKGNNTAEVKKVVKDFMEQLISLNNSNEFVQDFLSLIKERMLIVESLKEDGTKNGRACARTVVEELDNMRKKLPREP
ncbi:protein kinase [Fusarium flagelliforme]|uniref:Protein kinase n=1 Tax=Fusarium flagelliforme TaxID=2675880 RepID=A0A395MM67_9HYPO|nr:protein kinase [Fusarium flagelliforme]